jgi:hypothetical protein
MNSNATSGPRDGASITVIVAMSGASALLTALLLIAAA